MIKIVFIDDEFLIIEGLKRIIEWEKYNIEIVGTAQNSVDALEIIRNKKPDIVITDIKMRGTDGLELINNAINLGYDGYTIILSGYQEFEYARRAIDNKVYKYLLKPIDVDELKNTIEEIVKLIREKGTFRETKKDVFSEALRYIDSHFNEDIQLVKIAKMYHFEVTYFSKKFKEIVGVNYSDYVTQLRLEAAKRYLEETDMGVNEICDQVGYSDVRYFREIFKKNIGMTPREYKNSKKGEEK